MFHKRLDHSSYQISCPGDFLRYFIRTTQIFANPIALVFAAAIGDAEFLAFLHAVTDLFGASVTHGMIDGVLSLNASTANVTYRSPDDEGIDLGNISARFRLDGNFGQAF